LLTTRSPSTPSPLRRLYRTKFALVAVVSAVGGIALIVLAHWAAVDPSGAWLRTWPVNEIGLGLFITRLFGVLFHHVGQRDPEEEQIRRLRQVIADDLAGRPDGLVAMVSSETRDRIAESCLRLQLVGTRRWPTACTPTFVIRSSACPNGATTWMSRWRLCRGAKARPPAGAPCSSRPSGPSIASSRSVR
jgi:hypothetical protein